MRQHSSVILVCILKTISKQPRSQIKIEKVHRKFAPDSPQCNLYTSQYLYKLYCYMDILFDPEYFIMILKSSQWQMIKHMKSIRGQRIYHYDIMY